MLYRTNSVLANLSCGVSVAGLIEWLNENRTLWHLNPKLHILFTNYFFFLVRYRFVSGLGGSFEFARSKICRKHSKRSTSARAGGREASARETILDFAQRETATTTGQNQEVSHSRLQTT